MSNPYFWPGSNIVKSLDNAFNWQVGDAADIMQKHLRHLRQSEAGKANVQLRIKKGIEKGEPYYITPSEKPYQKSFTTYSKAVPKK